MTIDNNNVISAFKLHVIEQKLTSIGIVIKSDVLGSEYIVSDN